MDQLKNTAKGHLESYLKQKGLNPQKPFNCLNPGHADKNPSMSYDRRRNRVHCFACGVNYDIFDLVGLDYHLGDSAEIFQKTYQLLGLEEPGRGPRSAVKPAAGGRKKPIPPAEAEPTSDAGVQKKYLEKCRARLGETDYPQKRGLSPAVCRRFGLGFDPSFPAGGGQKWAALIIPTGPDSFTARNTDPAADKGARIRKKGASPVFNAEVLWEETGVPALVVEGEIDALAVHEAGGAAVALGSTANVGAFLNLARSRPPLRPLALALDNDEEGRRAGDKLEEGLLGLRARFFRINPYGDLKDAAEALVGDPGAFSVEIAELVRFEAQAAQAEREEYLSACAAGRLDAFRNVLTGLVDTPAQPTGFAGLDAALDGGLYEGLYVVGGISSLGKTSLAIQLADQLARSGRDVLIFSLEMSAAELMAKSLSRLTLLTALACGLPGSSAKTARGITGGARYARYNGQELRLIGAAIEEYAKYADKIFISEGVGDIGAGEIRAGVEKHLRVAGRPPAVVVDYLQILAPPSDRATDKQNIDKNVLELKRLSRDFKIPVVGLSSFNRANYREAVAMEAFKESGAIEYSSDVLMGLQLKGAGEKDFDALAEKARNPRRVELVILKNRQGPAGKTVEFEYYPEFNYFREAGERGF